MGKSFITIAFVSVVWLCFSVATARAAIFFGPTHYLSAADIPTGFYAGGSPAALEDFEDRTLGFGITASDGRVAGNEPSVDSVDGDDGSIDGSGLAGFSWYSVSSRPYADVTFTFSGSLPTAAAMVWTDGNHEVTFEAFDPGMASLGSFSTSAVFVDSDNNGGTAEDSFFGVQDPGGILAIRMFTNTGSGIEVDHVQFGSAADANPNPDPDPNAGTVPEPSSLLAWTLLGAAAFWRGRRRLRK